MAIWDMGYGIWVMGFGAWDLEFKPFFKSVL